MLSIWNTLSSVCSKKKEESGESEGNPPSSDSMMSSSCDDHVAVEMEPAATAVAVNPVDKPVSPVEKPATPVASATPSTPVSAGKRVQTPVKPIKGAGPETNPSWISSNQNQNQTQESESKLDSEADSH